MCACHGKRQCRPLCVDTLSRAPRGDALQYCYYEQHEPTLSQGVLFTRAVAAMASVGSHMHPASFLSFHLGSVYLAAHLRYGDGRIMRVCAVFASPPCTTTAASRLISASSSLPPLSSSFCFPHSWPFVSLSSPYRRLSLPLPSTPLQQQLFQP
jgi:hypothetical protein